MSKLEKFKELLEQLEYTGELIGRSTTLAELEVHIPKKINIEQQLIKMYEEKTEKQEESGKPIVHVKEIKIYDTGLGFTEISYIISKNICNCYTDTLEEKDGMLITDDFIFIKAVITNVQE